MSKELVQADDLTNAEIDEVCADLLAKAEAHLAEAEKVRSCLEKYGVEDSESAGTALVKLGDEARAAQEHVEHVRCLLAEHAKVLRRAGKWPASGSGRFTAC